MPVRFYELKWEDGSINLIVGEFDRRKVKAIGNAVMKLNRVHNRTSTNTLPSKRLRKVSAESPKLTPKLFFS